MISPFKYNILHHYHLTFDCLKKDFKNNKKLKMLDYGCGNGEFIGNLSMEYDLYGYDVDPEKIRSAKKQFKHVKFILGKVGRKLPYKNNFFDAVFLFHVLEHVDSEKRVIEKVYRVLKDGGLLFLASPYKGLFTWADTANLRYRFPVLHKILAKIFYGEDEYHRRFIEKKKDLLFGDSSINRQWHKHYTESQVRNLLKGKFSVEQFIKFSFFQPFLLILWNLWTFLFKKESNILRWLVYLDDNLQVGDLSYNMLVIAKKDEAG